MKMDWNKIKDKMKEQEGSSSSPKEKDSRFYIPKDVQKHLSEKGKYEAVIRFLPSKDTDLPYVKIKTHNFEGPGGWYNQKCPYTIKAGKEDVCPACESYWDLYPADPTEALKRRNNEEYIGNILVVNDPQNEECNGKVFLFKFKRQIFTMIKEAIDPPAQEQDPDSLDDEPKESVKPVMVFDPDEGANFLFKITQNQKYYWYEQSKFKKSTPIGDDDFIEKIEESLYPLAPFIDESEFKSYDDLMIRLNRVLTGKKGEKSDETGASDTDSDNKPEVDPPKKEKELSEDDKDNLKKLKEKAKVSKEKSEEKKAKTEKKEESKEEPKKDSEDLLNESLVASDEDFFANL